MFYSPLFVLRRCLIEASVKRVYACLLIPAPQRDRPPCLLCLVLTPLDGMDCLDKSDELLALFSRRQGVVVTLRGQAPIVSL